MANECVTLCVSPGRDHLQQLLKSRIGFAIGRLHRLALLACLLAVHANAFAQQVTSPANERACLLGWATCRLDLLTPAQREAVRAAEFIEALPGGYDAPVAERGATLSTGQKQLLSFARALAFDRKVLILDEATSSIDTDTEIVIRRALEVLMRGRTTIAIAHRLSTIQDMDAILVLHKGVIRESGTHQALLAERGIYYKLYQLQFQRVA